MKAITLFLALFASTTLWASEVNVELSSREPLIHTTSRTHGGQEILAPWFQVDATLINASSSDLLISGFDVKVVSPDGADYQTHVNLNQEMALGQGQSVLVGPLFVDGLPLSEIDFSYSVWLKVQGRLAGSQDIQTLAVKRFQTR